MGTRKVIEVIVRKRNVMMGDQIDEFQRVPANG